MPGTITLGTITPNVFNETVSVNYWALTSPVDEDIAGKGLKPYDDIFIPPTRIPRARNITVNIN